MHACGRSTQWIRQIFNCIIFYSRTRQEGWRLPHYSRLCSISLTKGQSPSFYRQTRHEIFSADYQNFFDRLCQWNSFYWSRDQFNIPRSHRSTPDQSSTSMMKMMLSFSREVVVHIGKAQVIDATQVLSFLLSTHDKHHHIHLVSQAAWENIYTG